MFYVILPYFVYLFVCLFIYLRTLFIQFLRISFYVIYFVLFYFILFIYFVIIYCILFTYLSIYSYASHLILQSAVRAKSHVILQSAVRAKRSGLLQKDPGYSNTSKTPGVGTDTGLLYTRHDPSGFEGLRSPQWDPRQLLDEMNSPQVLIGRMRNPPFISPPPPLTRPTFPPPTPTPFPLFHIPLSTLPHPRK